MPVRTDTPSALNVDLAPGADASDLKATSSWLGRPQLIRNPVTDTWIIWAEVGGKKTATKPDGTVVSLGNAQAVFTSESLTGRYTYQGKHYTNRSNGDGTFTFIPTANTSGT